MMRLLGTLLVSTALAAVGAVILLALVAILRGSGREYAPDATRLEMPSRFEIDPAPLEVVERRIRFGQPVDASHGKQVALRGRLDPGLGLSVVLLVSLSSRGRLIQRARPDEAGAFEFPSVAVGRYELRGRLESGRSIVLAKRIELTRDTDLDLRPPAAQTFPFRLLLVEGSASEPLPLGHLVLLRDGSVVADGCADQGGHVSLTVAPGPATWLVWASGPGWPAGGKEWRGSIELGEAATPIELELAR